MEASVRYFVAADGDELEANIMLECNTIKLGRTVAGGAGDNIQKVLKIDV